jgi:hypothetical protein
LVRFKAAKKNLKEYGKKKKGIGLDYLEFGSESESESETDVLKDSIPVPELEDEYRLPRLPKPPSLYDECALQLDDLNDKILDTLSSSPCRRYTVTNNTTKEYLMRRSLYGLEIQQAHAGQIATHKSKLNYRLRFQKGGSILASIALKQKMVKLRKIAEERLRKAQLLLTRAENKEKQDLRVRGVATRKQESNVSRLFQSFKYLEHL